MDGKKHFIIQFVIFALVFAAILLQSFTHLIPMKPLGGYDNVERPDTWEERAKQNTGFREFFIRNYNQVVYSCFRRITNDNIREGANRELYLMFYLNDVTGGMLRGYYADEEQAKAAARENVEETLRMIDTLRQHGKEFLFVFAPSKTWVYPENMPQRFTATDFTYQEYYIELFKEKGIPHIDFLDYFRSVKDTVPYPLFTRAGTHWAQWTIPWVADSILRKMEEFAHYDLPKVQDVDLCITRDYTDKDRELEDQMNLLFPLSKPPMPKPSFHYTDTLGKDRPNLLVVGDSYATQLVVSDFGKVFNHWDFWVYNRDLRSSRPRFQWRKLNEELEAIDMLRDADIVMAVFTAPNYYDFMFGFPKSVQNLYRTGFFDEDQALNTLVEMIKTDSLWYNAVVKQAETRNITVDEAVYANARYTLELKRQRNLNPQ